MRDFIAGDDAFSITVHLDSGFCDVITPKKLCIDVMQKQMTEALACHLNKEGLQYRYYKSRIEALLALKKRIEDLLLDEG